MIWNTAPHNKLSWNNSLYILLIITITACLVTTTKAPSLDFSLRVQEHNHNGNDTQSLAIPDDEPLAADLSIAVISAPERVLSGEQLTFNIMINNIKSQGFNGWIHATLQTTLSVNVENPSNDCEIIGQVLKCYRWLFGDNNPTPVSVSVWVKSNAFSDQSGDSYTGGTWTISSGVSDPDLSNNSANYSTSFNSKADIGISILQDTDPIIAGNSLVYDYTVWNYGPDKAFNVQVINTLPISVTFVTSTTPCDTSAFPVVICNLGNISVPQRRSFSIQAIVESNIVAYNNGSAFVTNSAEVRTDSIDPYELDNRAEQVKLIGELSDLDITNDCKSDQPVKAGVEGNCTILIENFGPSTARNVALVGTLYSNADFEPGTDFPAECVLSHDDRPFHKPYKCNLGNLLKGERFTIIVPVTSNEPQDIGNYAVVSSDTPEQDVTNNQATDSVPVSALVDLAVDFMNPPSQTPVSNTLVYSLEISNNGPSTAHDVVITSTLPNSATIGEIDGGTGRCSLDENLVGNQVICTLGTIAGSAKNIVTIAVTPTAETTVKHLTTVTARESDENPINNSISIETIAFIHRLFLPVISHPSDKADLIGQLTLNPKKKRFIAGEAVQITAIITNIGLSSTESFWADLYINPAKVPEAANEKWQDLCAMTPCFGIAWHFDHRLEPGQSITLTSSTDDFVQDFTNWPGWFATDTSDIYLYVDSYASFGRDGSISEANENNNRSEILGLTVTGNNPFVTSLSTVSESYDSR